MLTILLLACTGSTPLPPASASYSGSLGPGPDFSEPHGRIAATVYPSEATAVLWGAFADGPALSFHSTASDEGNCRLITYTPSSCDPGCDTDAACIDGECVTWPERESRGTLEWTVAGAVNEVEPDDTDGYYATATAAEASEMSLAFDGIELTVPAAPALEADGDWASALADRGDDDGVLAWSNPMEGARVRLHMSDCVASHGGIAEAEIECEGPDTGELVIPDAYLDALEEGDWSHGECGSHTFERYHAAAPEGDDSVRFESYGTGGLFYFPGMD